MTVEETWVLAFDASCGTCREVSDAVRLAAAGRLEVLPLNRPDVEEWRHRALGEDAPWAPTLLRVVSGDVQAWTGAGMALPLTRRLGVRASMTVVQSLGRLRRDVHNPIPESGGTARRNVLRFGAGLSVAAGIMFAGKAPAFADERCQAAKDWVAENIDKLPTSYDDVARYQIAYRRAIVAELTPVQQSALWVEHLKRYRSEHAGMAPEQDALIERFIAVAADASTFDGAPPASVEELHPLAVDGFGEHEASRILAGLGGDVDLGPGNAAPSNDVEVTCSCSVFSDYCSGSSYCTNKYSCTDTTRGCGTYWVWACNGRCCVGNSCT